jgi:hypothetical protein
VNRPTTATIEVPVPAQRTELVTVSLPFYRKTIVEGVTRSYERITAQQRVGYFRECVFSIYDDDDIGTRSFEVMISEQHGFPVSDQDSRDYTLGLGKHACTEDEYLAAAALVAHLSLSLLRRQ